MEWLLYFLGIKKRPQSGFRFWKGIAWIYRNSEHERVEFEIHLKEPIEDPYFLELSLKRDENFRVNGVRPYNIMVPEKRFWTMTFTVNIDK